MSKNKIGWLDQYGTGPFEQQQFGTTGVDRVKHVAWMVGLAQLVIADGQEKGRRWLGKDKWRIWPDDEVMWRNGGNKEDWETASKAGCGGTNNHSLKDSHKCLRCR